MYPLPTTRDPTKSAHSKALSVGIKEIAAVAKSYVIPLLLLTCPEDINAEEEHVHLNDLQSLDNSESLSKLQLSKLLKLKFPLDIHVPLPEEHLEQELVSDWKSHEHENDDELPQEEHSADLESQPLDFLLFIRDLE
jgi:hypothetical protein